MIQVAKNLYRGPRPKDLRALQELGITWIVNLQSGVYELFHEDRYEKQYAHEFGMIECDYGLSDFSAPDKRVVLDALQLITECTSLLNKKVYVHCKHGVDRTGFVIAAYRIAVEGWPREKAIAEMYAHGFHKFPYLFWVPHLNSYSKMLMEKAA